MVCQRMATRAWLDSNCQYAIFHRGFSNSDSAFFDVFTAASRALDGSMAVSERPRTQLPRLAHKRVGSTGALHSISAKALRVRVRVRVRVRGERSTLILR